MSRAGAAGSADERPAVGRPALASLGALHLLDGCPGRSLTAWTRAWPDTTLGEQQSWTALVPGLGVGEQLVFDDSKLVASATQEKL
jgi:hypothetical protein